jgi:hypothetical protein
MGKKSLDWEFPPDMAFLLLGPLIMCVIAFSAGSLLPVVMSLKSADLYKLYFSGLGIAGFGTVLLFMARLPLYRKGCFWTVGQRELDRLHRRLYWLAYLIILAGLGLLGVVWLRTS